MTEQGGAGVLVTVPPTHVLALECVRLRLVRPEAGATDGARAAVVACAPPPRGTTTLVCVELTPGAGGGYAEAATTGGMLEAGVALVVETDADPPLRCTATVIGVWHGAGAPRLPQEGGP